MLVLSRKKDQKIILSINEKNVEITVVKIDQSSVRLGIQAPADVTILRSELLSQSGE